MGNLEVILSILLHITHTCDLNMAYRPLWSDSCPPSWSPLPSCALVLLYLFAVSQTCCSLSSVPFDHAVPLASKACLAGSSGFYSSKYGNLQLWKSPESHFWMLLTDLWATNFSCVLYAICLYFLQSNDHNMLYICMSLDLIVEARAMVLLQDLCLPQCLGHRRHSIYLPNALIQASCLSFFDGGSSCLRRLL